MATERNRRLLAGGLVESSVRETELFELAVGRDSDDLVHDFGWQVCEEGMRLRISGASRG